MKTKTLADVMICPHCKSENCYEHSTDEIEFNSNGIGHYFVDCHCVECQKDFRLCTYFNYSITEAYTRS